MGRLTLNILLSFAQFEREVTGERIRDKFAASRKKGMWMGGFVPLGCDVKDRKLVANASEAAIVRCVFKRFTKVRSATALVGEMRWEGICGKRCRLIDKSYVYQLFRNRVYLGEAVHKARPIPASTMRSSAASVARIQPRPFLNLRRAPRLDLAQNPYQSYRVSFLKHALDTIAIEVREWRFVQKVWVDRSTGGQMFDNKVEEFELISAELPFFGEFGERELRGFAVEPDQASHKPRQAAIRPKGTERRHLAFQWDTVHELIILEGARRVKLPSSEEAFVERLARLGACVPEGAELGYHLCYGDSGRKHSVDPKDMGLMVRFVNRLVTATPRPINYVHMPVPRDREDAAYFAPLGDLRLKPETELYLGLVSSD